MRDVEALVGEMTLEEKAALTAGANFWSTAGIERLGIPPVWMTDGPNGARGAALGGEGRALTAACVPCGAALGATWDPALVERIGVLVGAEARTKGCRVLLAPTVNLHRSPLGGRNFESYSEDPLLAGTLAVAYVRGVQSQDVATTVKHFAGNESEFERMTMDAVIDERTLRELYLLPFELAVRDGGALGVMTAYNRLNGVYCSDSEHLLRDILRTEWGFEGFVVTDWGACGTTAGAARAGVDLEMPGPGRFYGPALVDAVKSGDVDEAAVDDAVRRLLRVFARIGALRDPVERVPTSVDRPEDRALAREAAAAGTVLMKNDDALLPLDAESIRTLAVIGPNAARVEIMGGGSAHLPAHYQVSPLRALQDRLGDRVTLLHEPGVDTSRLAPVLADADLSAGDGLLLEVFEGHDFAGAVVERSRRTHTEITFLDPNTAPTRPEFSVRAAAGFTPTDSGPHTFSLAQLGHARLLVDGVVRLDGMTDPPPPGTSFLGFGSAEMTTSVDLQGGRAVELVVEFANVGAPRLSGVRIGCRRPAVPDRLERAVSAAAGADAAVVIVGTGHEWESEGHDRMSMSLPGEQDELIERVLAVNLRTVVVLNAGSVVTMPWAEKARAVLQIWFGGQEMSNALVDVLFGDADPGGRLPTTVPMCLEHNPSYGNFPAENGRLRYGEGGLVGYRWYDTRRLPTRFPFGHGLSYTNFAIGEPRLSAPTFTPGGTLTVDVPVTNTAARAGSEVVQCYVAPASSRLTRPSKELKAFAKVRLEPGETTVVRLTLGDRSFAYWDDGDSQPADGSVSQPLWMMQPTSTNTRRGWRIEAGTCELRIGRSSSDITHVLPLDIGGQWCD